MDVRVLPQDDVKTMAEKIYKHFRVNQSCAIIGEVIIIRPDGRRELLEKGKAVLDQINEYDRADNFFDCGKRRKRINVKNSIGGDVAHKIWKFKRTIEHDQIKYSIWRYQ